MTDYYHIGFTGSQKGMNELQYANFMSFLLTWKDNLTKKKTVLHHGDCIGADHEAHMIARELGFLIHLHLPTNHKSRAFCDYDFIEPELPYLTRNKKIVESSAIILAVSGYDTEVLRSGTWSTIRYADKLNRTFNIFLPNGKIINTR